MAVHVPALPRPDVWHRRFGPTLALLLVLVPFAAILTVAALSAAPADETDVAVTLNDTAALVDSHAEAMLTVGQRITAAAQASSASDRLSWIAYGQHMVSDGKDLQGLASRMRDDAVVAAEDPLHSGRNVAVSALQARWEQLKADGQTTATHGRVMQSITQDMAPAISSGIVSAADAKKLQDASTGMVDAGERIVSAANVLLASTDQMQRWMGNP
ncbi:MAG: hypothetical protein KGN00_01385 [Chloroflexota bacterium]|nr:hypothetical protein [Chloroflexota bacterium]